MANVADTRDIVQAQTLIGVFDTEAAARSAVSTLERSGMPPDRIGLVSGNIRQAREVAGSYSPQGALIGALIGVVLVVLFAVLGGESFRQNAAGIVMGGFAIIGGLAFIGWLAGRARLFKEDRYAHFEDESALGEILVSVVCDTPEGFDATRAILERAKAREIRVEDSAESV
jgi:hypothetical protein